MKKMMLPIACMFVVFSLMINVQGAINPIVPIFTFEMAVHSDIYLDGNETTLALVTLHETSSSWLLYIEHNDDDVYPYDNISLSIQCNDALTPTVLYTTGYDDWNNNGSISINFNYQDESYDVYYNSIDFVGKYSDCVLSADSVSFDGNGAYDIVVVEMIPQLGVLEFISCDSVESFQIGISEEVLTIVQIMTDVWNILWYTGSTFVLIISLFGIPMLAFLMFRWALYKITGYKLVERRV
jgi:hypothetical protein